MARRPVYVTQRDNLRGGGVGRGAPPTKVAS
jgi:hypothetical protein